MISCIGRRRFLHAAGAIGTALLAGCIGSQNGAGDPTPTRTQTEAPTPTPDPTPTSTPEPVDPDDLSGFVRPEGDPETVPSELVCEADYEFERHGQSLDHIDEPTWGYGDGDQSVFSLRVDERTFERGDEVTITLTNLTTEAQFMGIGGKYYLQVYTEAGWMDIRVHPDDNPVVAYPDSAQAIPPRGEFGWSFELTEDQVFAGHFAKEWLDVCPGLPTGRYRFVYWGLPDIEHSLMVGFDLVE